MPQIQLSEQAFRAASDHARAGGYSSVDEYVSDVVLQGTAVAELFDEVRLRELDQISAEVRDGATTYPIDELRTRYRQQR